MEIKVTSSGILHQKYVTLPLNTHNTIMDLGYDIHRFIPI